MFRECGLKVRGWDFWLGFLGRFRALVRGHSRGLGVSEKG